jgi:antitoxin PrlF
VEARAKVTSKGQVTIPRAVRQALRVVAGDTIVFDVDSDGVRLRPCPGGTVEAFVAARPAGRRKTVAEIVAEVRASRGE